MKRILSFILAAVMFVSLFATVAFAEGDTLEDIITEKYEDLMCISHSKLDLVFGTSATLNSLAEVMSEIFGYPASISDDELNAVKTEYGGLGNGQTAWPRDVEFTFSDPESGESCEVYFDLSLYKCVTGEYAGAIEGKGFFGCCPEDWPSDAKAGLKTIATKSQLFGDPGLFDDDTVIELTGDEFTADAIEAWFRDTTKLGADWTFSCQDPDASKAYSGQCVSIALCNHNVNDEGRTAIVSCSPTFKLHSDPLNEVIDEKYEDLVCVAHSKLDLVFGTSATLSSLPEVLSDLFGYPASIDDDEIEELKSPEKYGGLGDGQTAWETVTVTFSNPATGETYDIDMDLALYKAVTGKYCGAIEDKGFLGACPDDWPSEYKTAKLAIDDAHNATAPDFWNEEDVIQIPANVYTPGTIEAWYRDVTKLGDGWDFYIEGYDASEAYTGNTVQIGLANHNVNDEGRTVIIACGPTLKIAEGASIEESIDDRYEDLICVAHSKLDLLFGTSGTITTESLAAIMTKLFDYPATVDQDEVNAILAKYSGLGGGQSAWVDTVIITFTDPTTGAEYDKEMDLSIYKGIVGQYSGAIGTEGLLGICPEDWPNDAKTAGTKSAQVTGTVVELSGEAYTSELIEEWYRDFTKLGDEWAFFCGGLDEEKALSDDGNEVQIAFVNHNVNDEGRTMLVTCEPLIKFTKVEPPKVNFTDVAPDAYYADAVTWAVINDITAGTSPTTFSPENGCTRAQVVTFLWRAEGSPEPKTTKNPFKDVIVGEYYYKAVLWAVEEEITKGMTDNTFAPNTTCTRGQIVTFLYRWKGSPKIQGASNPFKDVKSGDYFYDAVLWAVANDITKGMTNNTFVPNNTCTRAQVVTFMYRGK